MAGSKMRKILLSVHHQKVFVIICTSIYLDTVFSLILVPSVEFLSHGNLHTLNRLVWLLLFYSISKTLHLFFFFSMPSVLDRIASLLGFATRVNPNPKTRVTQSFFKPENPGLKSL